MKRYDTGGGWSTEAAHGKWVLYEDSRELVAALQVAHEMEVKNMKSEIDALKAELVASISAREEMQLGGNRMAESLRFAKEEIADLKAELAALKTPPKVLSAEEVTEPGWYKVKFPGEPWEIAHIGNNDGDYSCCQFIGPIKMPEV